MKLSYNPKNKTFTVGKTNLVDYYIQKRKEDGRKPYQLETDASLSHPTLHMIENATPMQQQTNKSVRAILIALITLGYDIEVN